MRNMPGAAERKWRRATGASRRSFPGRHSREDLKRRDLTINAMAESASGGSSILRRAADLTSACCVMYSERLCGRSVRILRVGPASRPLRKPWVSACGGDSGLMERMTASGEVDALVSERVWQETGAPWVSRDRMCL